jgi:hypothetical protein
MANHGRDQPRAPAGSPRGGEWISTDDSYLYDLHHNPSFDGAAPPGAREAMASFWKNNFLVNAELRGTMASKEIDAEEYRRQVVLAQGRGSNPKEIISRLDKAFEKAPSLKDDATVYRGVDLAKMKVEEGSTFTDKGYACSSTDQPLVVRWVENAEDPAVMVIRMPKGTKYLPGDSEMAEVIPNRGAKFRVGKIKRRPGKVTLVEMEML